MGEDDPLGARRRSRGVDHHRRAVIVRRFGGKVAIGPEERIKRPPARDGCVAPDDGDPRHGPQGPHLFESGHPFVMDDEDRGSAVAERVADLERVVLVVQRHRDQPHPKAGEVADDRLEAVRQQESHPIAFLEPHGCEARCQPRGQPLELHRGGPRSVALEDRPVGIDLDGSFEQAMEHESGHPGHAESLAIRASHLARQTAPQVV